MKLDSCSASDQHGQTCSVDAHFGVHSQADAARKLLVRLSGRQMKRSRPFTLPALLAGMWTLLAMLNILQTHTLEELQELAQIALPRPRGP